MPATAAGVTDQFIAVAAETSYAEAATTFARVVPARNDSWEPNIQEVGTESHRPGRQAMAADQATQVPAGGTGSVEMLIPNSGNFLLLRDLLDEWDTDLDPITDASSLRRFNAASNGTGPPPGAARSLSYLVGRADQDQARREILYSGCVVTDWALSCDVGGPALLTVNYDWAQRTIGRPSSDAAYEPPDLSKTISGPWYTWRDLLVTIDDTPVPVVTSLTATGDRGLDTELFGLSGTELKAQPSRGRVPAYSVTLECRYDATTAALLDHWGDDEATGAIAITLLGRVDLKSSGATPITTSLTLSFAEAKVVGSEPVASLDAMTTISVALQPVDPYDGATSAATLSAVGAQTAID